MRAAFREVVYSYLGRPIIDSPYRNVRFLTRTLELRFSNEVLLLVNPIQIWGFRPHSYYYEDEEIRYIVAFRDAIMYIKTKTKAIKLVSNVEEVVFHTCRFTNKLVGCRVELQDEILTVVAGSPLLSSWKGKRYVVPDMSFGEARKYVYEMARRLV